MTEPRRPDNQHTPGPWHYEQPHGGFTALHDSSNKLIFGIAAGGAEEKQPDDVCEANMRLIAAAPETAEQRDRLVAICKQALRILRSEEMSAIFANAWLHKVAHQGDRYQGEVFDCVEAEAAIAAATGESDHG